MFKALLFQQWYQPLIQLRKMPCWTALASGFFVGLGFKPRVPDHSTISRFRAQPSRRGLGERLMAEVNCQLGSNDRCSSTALSSCDRSSGSDQSPSETKGTVAPATKAPQNPVEHAQ